MATKLIIPVEINATSESLNKVANLIKNTIKIPDLNESFKASLGAASTMLTNLGKKYKEAIPGESMSILDFKGMMKEGENASEYLKKTIRSLERNLKDVAMNPELKAETDVAAEAMKKYDAQIKAAKDRMEELQSAITVETTKGLGMGNIRDIEGIFAGGKKSKINLAMEKTRGLLADATPGSEQEKQYQAQLERQQAFYDTYILNYNEFVKKKSAITAAETKKTKSAEAKSAAEQKYIEEIARYKKIIEELKVALDNLNASQSNSTIAAEKQLSEQQKLTSSSEQFKSSIERVTTRFLSWAMVLRTIQKVMREAFKLIKELTGAFTEIAMVTTYSTKQAWQMKDSFVAIAKSTGESLSDIAETAVDFFRQGRSMSEVLKLTEAAALSAKIANISVGDSVKYLTSAINGYQLSANQAIAVSDKFAALAASSATDYEELAIALSKVAAQAYSAGVNLDNMMGFIAKAIETTREAPENIGTAFKTIFARMSELKDFGKTVEDGMDVNRISKALDTIGVSLTDQEGQIRNLDEVLIEVGYKWKDLTKNQKAYIATALAGTRQQTRLLAVFEDFDRTMELTEISSNSLGASYAMQEKYYSSLNYALSRLTTSWQDFIINIGNTAPITAVVEIFETLVNTLNFLPDKLEAVGSILLILGVSVLAWSTKAIVSNAAQVSSLQVLAAATYATDLAQKQAIQTKAAMIGLEVVEKNGRLALAGATNIYTASMKASVQQTLKFIGAILANPWTWVIAGAVTSFILLEEAINGTERASKKYYDSIRSFSATTYNNQKQINSVQNLVEKYETLDKKIVKTTAELNQMQEIMQQIQDITGEDVVININGKLNIVGVEAFIENQKLAIEAEYEKITSKIKNEFANSISYAYEDALERGEYLAQQQYINLQAYQNAVAQGLVDNLYDFTQMTGKQKDILLNQAKAILETPKPIMASGFTAVDEKVAKAAIAYYDDLIKKAKEAGDARLESDIELTKTQFIESEQEGIYNLSEIHYKEMIDLGKYLNQELLKSTSLLTQMSFSTANISEQYNLLKDAKFFDLSKDEQVALEKVFPQIRSILDLMERIGDNDILGQANWAVSAKELNNWVLALEDASLSQTSINKAIEDLIVLGPEETYKNLKKEIENARGPYTDILALQKSFNNLLDTMSIQDLSFASKSFSSIFDQLGKLNKMLSGEEMYDVSLVTDMLLDYGEQIKSSTGETIDAQKILTDAILSGQQLTIEQQKLISEGAKQQLLKDLEYKKVILENDKSRIETEIATYEAMLKDEGFMQEHANELNLAYDDELLKEKYNQYIDYLKLKYGADLEAAKANIKLDQTLDDQQKANAIAALERNSKLQLSYINTAGEVETAANAFEAAIQNKLTALRSSLKDTNSQITSIEGAIKKINDIGALKLFEDSQKDADDYIAKLTKIYILEQKLLILRGKLDEYNAILENPISGQEYVDSVQSIIKTTELEIDTLEQLIDARKEAQTDIYNGLVNQGLSDTFEIINGRLIPIWSKYNSLSNDNKKIADEAATSFNDLADAIHEDELSIRELNKVIEDNNRLLKEKTIELYDLMADAIRASAEKQLEVLKKQIDEENRLLDKRKEMYDKAFSEEDYTNSLQETTVRREEIIEQLATLEGATDLASLKRREELLKEKAELDKEYNTTVRDYNREALFESIDNEIEGNNQIYDTTEEETNARLEDIQWVQDEINRIIADGTAQGKSEVDAIVDYLKENLPEYIEAFDIQKDLLIDGYQELAEITVAYLDEIEDGMPDFSDLLRDLTSIEELINNIGDGGSSGGGSGVTPKPTPTPKISYIIEWRAIGYFNKDGIRYRQEEEWKVTLTNGVKTNEVKTGKKRNVAIGRAVNTATTPVQTLAIDAHPASSAITPYATGGLATETGLAMLHGTPKAPERVLSAVQTQLFERLVSSLEGNVQGGQLGFAGVTIGSINITTPELNTNQDFAAAGTTFAKAFKDAIAERGININKKR